jgi:hypothetical protein
VKIAISTEMIKLGIATVRSSYVIFDEGCRSLEEVRKEKMNCNHKSGNCP